MAKRELCYKEDVKKNHEKWIGYLDEDMIARLNIAVDKHIPTFTEQDIVKPYLEKLKEQIMGNIERYTLARESHGMGKVEWSDFLIKQNNVIELIDNLLSEQGEIHCDCTDAEIAKSFIEDVSVVEDRLAEQEAAGGEV